MDEGWRFAIAAQHALAVEVLKHGPLERAELGRRLSLSPASLTRLSAPLLQRGLFVELPAPPAARGGRPARPLDIDPAAHSFVGVEVRHDGVYGAVTDLRTRLLRTAHRAVADRGPDSVVAAVARLVKGLTRNLPAGAGPPAALGVSIGGLVDEAGVVRRAPFLDWTEPVPLGESLRRRTGTSTVVDNDLVALTKAEHWFGVARGCPHVAVVTIGIGVGYGLVVHDRTVEAPDSGVGLLGHHPLRAGGPRCLSGHSGCAAAMLSSPLLAARVSAAPVARSATRRRWTSPRRATPTRVRRCRTPGTRSDCSSPPSPT